MSRFEDLARRRFFFAPAFELYGGCAGLFDYGPAGCAVKNNILTQWRQFFIVRENMLEVDCTTISPEMPLMASGHVGRFSDPMVRDAKTNEMIRADHLLENILNELPEGTERKKLENISGTRAKELEPVLRELNIPLARTSDNSKIICDDIGLMFSTDIGPVDGSKGYLRPELAQGIFLNFKRLLEYNQGRLPFAGAQIGRSYRNEIAPRQMLIRMREFTQAEIEYFYDPENGVHPKFASVAEQRIIIWSREDQENKKESRLISINDAVRNNIIAGEILGYFIARTASFLTMIGIPPQRLRFRQHLKKEMAHYARDCWDAEINCSFGWIECVGIANRSCYDLECHSKRSKLKARQVFEKPRKTCKVQHSINKAKLGAKLGDKTKSVIEWIEKLTIKEACAIIAKMTIAEPRGTLVLGPELCGESITLEPGILQIQIVEKMEHQREFYPHVVEPSFGIDRILYCLLENAYWIRPGSETRSVLSLQPVIAPVKCSILPISSGNSELDKLGLHLQEELATRGISSRVDASSQALGRRYARTDELGLPFAITMDFKTLEDKTITLRERDSMVQVRIPVNRVSDIIYNLSEAKTTWETVMISWPRFEN